MRSCRSSSHSGFDSTGTIRDILSTFPPEIERLMPKSSRALLEEGRIVVTKDSDFVQTFLLTDQPQLLLVSTGNIENAELESLLRNNLAAIERAFGSARFVELTRVALIVHQ